MLTSLTDRVRRLIGLKPTSPLQGVLPFWSNALARRQSWILREARPYTMTSTERVVALCQSIAYLEHRNITGDIVECGVWKGGSMLAAALTLLSLGSTRRRLFLFDTFAGMTEPGEIDRDFAGRPAHEILRESGPAADLVRARCSLEEARQTMFLARYPWEKIVFVPGPVEETLPAAAPARIALLRLDTDWYESTWHELTHLWPRLVEGGVLIVDDFGHWQGAKAAVEDYFTGQGIRPDLHAIDYTGRLIVKKTAKGSATLDPPLLRASA